MAVTNITYATDAAITVTAWNNLASQDVASSAAFTNSSNYVDVLVGGTIDVTATTVAAGEHFDVYCSAMWDDDTASNYGGGIDTLLTAGDNTLTIDTELVLANMQLIKAVRVRDTTPDVTLGYHWGPVSIASHYGGVMPQQFMLVLHNNTGSALSGTGNVVNAVGITYTST